LDADELVNETKYLAANALELVFAEVDFCAGSAVGLEALYKRGPIVATPPL
jgi:hypothetical protein